MKKLKVGYLSLVKGSWINDKLESQRLNALEALKVLDVELVDCGLLIQSETEADAVCKMFDELRARSFVHGCNFSHQCGIGHALARQT